MDIAADKALYYFLMYFFKFSHLIQAFLEKSLIPMSFSYKIIIMLDKAVKNIDEKLCSITIHFCVCNLHQHRFSLVQCQNTSSLLCL